MYELNVQNLHRSMRTFLLVSCHLTPPLLKEAAWWGGTTKHAVRWTTFKDFTHWTFRLYVSNSEGTWRHLLATSSVFTLAVGWIFFKANTEKEDKEKKRNEGSFLEWQCRHGEDKSVVVRVQQTGQVVESLWVCSHSTDLMARRRRCLLTLQSWSATCWPSLQQNSAAHKPSHRHHVWVWAARADCSALTLGCCCLEDIWRICSVRENFSWNKRQIAVGSGNARGQPAGLLILNRLPPQQLAFY